MNAFVLIGTMWLLHAVPLIMCSAPIWYFARKKVQWTRWDYLILIAPFSVWLGLMLLHGEGKSLSNAFIEPLALGCSAPVAPTIRAILRDRFNQASLAVCLLVALCFIAFTLWALVPGLPE